MDRLVNLSESYLNGIVSSSLKRLLMESNNNQFESCLDELDNHMKSYIDKMNSLLNNKLSYFETVKNLLNSNHNKILKLDYNYSLIKSEIRHNSLFEVKYFINGSLSWDDNIFFENENTLWDLFNSNELYELGIDISLHDMRDKGGECYISMSFDMDSIYDFDFEDTDEFYRLKGGN